MLLSTYRPCCYDYTTDLHDRQRENNFYFRTQEVDLELAAPAPFMFPLCWSSFSTFSTKKLPLIPGKALFGAVADKE
jgi:hypothetical protein